MKLFAYPADRFRRAQLAFDAAQAVNKLSKEVIMGEKASTISEVLDAQSIADFATLRSIIREEINLKDQGASEGAVKKKTSDLNNMTKNTKQKRAPKSKSEDLTYRPSQPTFQIWDYPATTDPMVKYHLFNSIAHKDFDTFFLSTDDSERSSYTTRQTDEIFRQSGHFGSK